MNKLSLKALGMLATVAGLAISLVSKYVDDKEIEQKIDDAVDKALAERFNEEEA